MKKTPELFFVLRRYGDYMRKKGSPEIIIKDYFTDILRIFEGCNKIEYWRKIRANQIENYIRNQKRGQNTMAKRSYQMRSFMKFCRIKGYPTIEGYKILPNKRRQKEAKFLQDYEVQKIIEYAEKNTKHLALIKLFLTTGCRLSEVSSITKDQIENAVKIGNVYQLNIIGKGAKLRSIFPPIETIELCKNLKGNTPILGGRTRSKIGYTIKKISKETNIRFSPHTLRHTYLSYLARQGADIYKIQKIAGHTSILTTSIYLHCYNKELAETASLIQSLV